MIRMSRRGAAQEHAISSANVVAWIFHAGPRNQRDFLDPRTGVDENTPALGSKFPRQS
jgi:hypothetical protein